MFIFTRRLLPPARNTLFYSFASSSSATGPSGGGGNNNSSAAPPTATAINRIAGAGGASNRNYNNSNRRAPFYPGGRRGGSALADSFKGIASVQVANGDVETAFKVIRRRAREEGRMPRFYLPHARHIKRSVEIRKDLKARIRRCENRQLREIIIQSMFFEKFGYDKKYESRMAVIMGSKKGKRYIYQPSSSKTPIGSKSSSMYRE
jgi:hypothetical protein